jgi:hypothetical protein
MELPDGTTLMHGRVAYDPKKAHDYYLRTRKLKGRKKVSPQVAAAAKRLAGKSDAEITAEINKTKDPNEAKLMQTLLKSRQKLRGKTAVAKAVSKPKVKATLEQKQAAAKQVTSIRSELAELNNRLKEAKAKARKSETKAKRGPTAADKSEKARESKKYRDKHKQTLANKGKTATNKDKASGKTRADSVTSLERKISETKDRLVKAIAKEKALS